MNHPQHSKLQTALDYWNNFAPCLGAMVTIYDGERGYWNSSTGLRQLESKQALQSNEPSYIYSITKTFTAVIILQLQEQGILDINKPACQYIDTQKFQSIELSSDITIKHLLNHTSGIPNYTELESYNPSVSESPSQSWSLDHVIELTLNGTLEFKPGEQWHYSNTGYMLLLFIIESQTGHCYAHCVKKYIVDKIQLQNTYVAEQVDNETLTQGYCRSLNSEGLMESISHKYDPWWCKTGLIVSTTEEVTKFYQKLFSNELIDELSLKQMLEARPINQPGGFHYKKPSYGLGLMIDPEGEHGGSFGHGGSGPGFNTYATYYPDFNGRPIIVTVFCNTTMGENPLYLIRDLLRELKG